MLTLHVLDFHVNLGYSKRTSLVIFVVCVHVTVFIKSVSIFAKADVEHMLKPHLTVLHGIQLCICNAFLIKQFRVHFEEGLGNAHYVIM